MFELLTDRGFFKYRSCHCGGSKTDKYKHGHRMDLQVNVKPNKGTFEIIQRGNVIARGSGDEFNSIFISCLDTQKVA